MYVFVPSWEFDIIKPFAYGRCDILHCTTNARFWNPMKVSALREKNILSIDNEELLIPEIQKYCWRLIYIWHKTFLLCADILCG